MTSKNSLLLAWVGLVTRRAWSCLGILTVLTVLLGWVAVSQFRMNSNLSDLITQSAPWRADFDHFERQFPNLVRTAVVVVSSDSLKKLELATAKVVAHLQSKPEFFTAVAAPGSETFFRDHALLYMGLDELDDMADRLAEAQPWLTAVAEDPSMRGILRLLGDGLENDPPAGFARVVELLSESAAAVLRGEDGTVWWSDELFPQDGTRYQLIYLKPKSSFEATLPDALVMQELRLMRERLALPEGVRLQFTGELALQHEEIEAAVTGVSMAGWLVLVLLLLVMVVGVRSAKIIAATFSMLAIGILWTSAYAMLTVGEYNTLSLVFIVMFFGLGVDFALHFSLRYQESINQDGTDVATALLTSTRSVGRAITLCTVTTALGFLGFWPTDYQGLADLGVISAGGMVVAWFLTFTFLPAFYAVCGPPRPHTMDLPTSDTVVRWLMGHRPWIVGTVLVLGLAAVYGATRASFDYSVLALKDSQAESMLALRELQREKLSTDYQLVSLGEAQIDKAGLQQLAVVNEVRTAFDWIPGEQQEKLYTVEDLQLMLWSALNPQAAKTAPHPRALRVRGQDLLTRLEAVLLDPDARLDVPPEALENFRTQLMGMLSADDDQWLQWQSGVIKYLLTELAWLRRATNVSAVGFDDLPETVRARLVSRDGEYLTMVLPEQDIADVDALSRFITDVRREMPNATGRPVIEWGVGGIVVASFQQALVFALTGITVVLVFALRNLRAVLLILLPLLLSAVFTLSLGVVFALPINMANILVIPLIFGLGVDNGIHVVDRYLGEGDVEHLMHSSTPRAVLLSTLTTIGAFAALSISPHAGTASIGLLLTIAVGLLLLFTLFLLPVLLTAGKRAL